LREDWIRDHTAPGESDVLANADDVINFNAESFKGEMA